MINERKDDTNNPFGYIIEYIDNDKVIGTLKYSYIYDRMELDNIYILEQYRGNGLGTKLMSYFISIAISKRVINVTLEVRISNEIARNLYQKFGFREVAVRKLYYGNEDGILMEKQVM